LLTGVILIGLSSASCRWPFRRKHAGPPTERTLVKQAMAARPADPWPRGGGHVLLAFPGSRREEKAYHEPGGSFSPAVGSFGISIGIADAAGALRTTSDAVPLEQITQSLLPRTHGGLPPSLRDETPLYEARWSTERPGTFALALTPARGVSEAVVIVRGVGPAGGPVHTVALVGDGLRVNDRWTLTMQPRPSSVKLGEEPHAPEPTWLARPAAGDAPHPVTSPSGWGFARLGWTTPGPVTVTVVDDQPRAESPLAAFDVAPHVEVSLPDPRFAASLQAQAEHLLMSLVGRETRPGEPTNYPLSWLRDGAYIIAALARAGHADLARELIPALAEHDFFGGFGAEGDGPGLALWAMDELAVALGDGALDRWLYPHVVRKAELIARMMETDRPIDILPLEGSIVPSWRDNPGVAPSLTRVCDASRDGLIIGRMDGQRPVLFVSAASYLGLERAARMATRAGEAATAAGWRTRAAALRASWLRGFATPERENDRTAISMLWPTWIGGQHRDVMRALLESRWSAQRTPDGGFKAPREWTYFDVAEMHQWLALGEPERTWATLRHYWDHQSSPGLFTWGEGSGEENSFGLWEGVRGWIAPKQVTPHYWTAAEMLLLQLEMLAYVDETDQTQPGPTYVVGAGVPAAWIDRPLSVKGVGTSRGVVDWSWRAGTLDVTIHGRPAPVQAGPAFGPGAVVHARFVPPGDVNRR
jgi:hypothetical protein